MDYTSAVTFQGLVGWWADTFVGMFDGKPGRITSETGGGWSLDVSWKRTAYSVAVAARPSGWMDGAWRTSTGTRGRADVRRYRDGVGALWFCEWFDEDDRSLLWIDARGPAQTKGSAEGKTAWISGGRQEWLASETTRAVLREGASGEELVMAFEMEGESYETLLRNDPAAGWRGTWTLNRGAQAGPLRGRVLRDEQDLFVVGEWVQGGVPYTFLAELAFAKRVI